ncbi:hypothetical protein F8388_018479 [Cannabis sativa]|uniref:Uncharacterized protein n=1 Tax=Cannabis sativa TaxID=3483 RepID=A0A7J6F265_CANSA|nr:hypothetical protein F8388_018479 [Cannabis sativa]
MTTSNKFESLRLVALSLLPGMWTVSSWAEEPKSLSFLRKIS